MTKNYGSTPPYSRLSSRTDGFCQNIRFCPGYALTSGEERFPPPFPPDWFWQLQLQWAMWINLAFCYLSSIFPWIDCESWEGRYINFSPRNCVSLNVSRLKMTQPSTFNDEIAKPNVNLVVHPNCYQSLLMTLNSVVFICACICVCVCERESAHVCMPCAIIV